MKSQLFTLSLTLALLPACLFAQFSFEIPDTVCVGAPVDIEYSGQPFSSICLVSEANFLSYDVSVEPIAAFPDNLGPLFAHVVQSENNFHLFATTFDTDQLVRLDFGTSLSNEPMATILELGIVTSGQEGIQVVNDNGHWWGFIIGGWFGGVVDPEYLLRLDFGNDLTNIPSVENLGNIGDLQFPHDLFLTEENGNWIGIAVNKTGNSLTRIFFGDDLGNTPTATNLGNLGGFDFPTGLAPIQVEGEWHFFITNEASDNLSRIDFGNSLLNIPTGVNLGNLGILDVPRDLTISRVCDTYFGILVNREGGEIIVLNFSNNIKNTPDAFSYGNFGGFDFPHSITKSHVTEEGVVFFICNATGKEISRIDFIFPFGLQVECDTTVNNFDISYLSPGNYMLQLLIDDGLPTQSSFCKDVVVIYPPDLGFQKDTTGCFDSPLLLESIFSNTTWPNQSVGSTFEVTEEGTYIGEAMVGNCVGTDTVEVFFEDCETCFFFPNVFTPNGDLVNDEFKPVMDCNPDILFYEMKVFNRWGQVVFQTDDPMIGWDGSFRGKASSMDVYVWKMNYRYAKNFQELEKNFSGDVSLIR